MDDSEQLAIQQYEYLINSNINKEEILFYLSEMFPMYKNYFSLAESDITKSVSCIFIFLRDVPGAFNGICKILSEECSQSFIVDSLQQFIASQTTETDTAPTEDYSTLMEKDCIPLISSDFVHTDLSRKILSKILSGVTSDIVITGPKGSGKSSLIMDLLQLLQNLKEKKFECLDLDLDIKRFSSILGKLESFVGEKFISDNKVIILDSCTQAMLTRLNDGSESSIYKEMKLKKITLIFVSNDSEFSLNLSNAVEFIMPSCSKDQIDILLHSNFNFIQEKHQILLSSIQNYPPYPLHLILVGSLFISLKESQFELMKLLPPFDDNSFVENTIKIIIDIRNNIDELHIIASVMIFHDVGGAYINHFKQLFSNFKFSSGLIDQSIENLVNCKILVVYKDRYYLRASFVKPVMQIEKFKNVWIKLLVHFCLKYLKYAEIIIQSLNDDKKLTKEWSNVKHYVIKALTCYIQSNDDSHQVILGLRCRVTSKLKSLWQARFLNFAECVDIYESITLSIQETSEKSNELLVWERTILIHYISLFFYFQKVPESKEILSSIFMNADNVIKKLPIPRDELYCEFISLIIEYKIQEGKLKDADRDLMTLIEVQQTIDTPKDNVTLNKIRLAQLKILQHEKLDFEKEGILGENFSCTPLSRPQLINTKIRMSRGDFYYMKNDFVATGWNYEMALYGIDDIEPDNVFMIGELNKVKQNIHCRIGMLGLQSGDSSEYSKSLIHFQKCQEYYGIIENDSKYHKYLIYTAVTHILMGNTSKALYDVLDYIKYTPHKPMFIAVTDLIVQQIISKNLQERMEGNELQFIDNHVYQGKVNFLHLTRVNYEWVKSQANDELIEIDISIPEKHVRANVLQFPDQSSQSNKCLVVVFLESQHQRIYSDRTNISEQTDASFSSFNTDIIDQEINNEYISKDHPVENQTHQSSNIIDSVYYHSLSFAKEFLDKAKASFFQNLTSSIVDQFF